MYVRLLLQTERSERKQTIHDLNSILALSQQHQAKQQLHRTHVHPKTQLALFVHNTPPQNCK